MTFANLVDKVVGVVNAIVFLIVGLSVLIIIWGVIKMIYEGDSKEGRENGRTRIIWGIIALAVALSTWGLVNLVVQSF